VELAREQLRLAAFLTTSVTRYFPAFRYLCVGELLVEVSSSLSSPKLQLHEVGSPLERSRNTTFCPMNGIAGDQSKSAASASGAPATVMVRVVVREPEL